MNLSRSTFSHRPIVYTIALSIAFHLLGAYWWLGRMPAIEPPMAKNTAAPIEVYLNAPMVSTMPVVPPNRPVHQTNSSSATPAPRTHRPSPAHATRATQTAIASDPPERADSTTGSTNEGASPPAEASSANIVQRSARAIVRPKPPYPRQSTQLQEEGTVVLSIFIEKTGRVAEVKVLQSSGFARLDSAAQQTVAERWQFEPEQRNGEAVAVWYQVPITFALTH